jgi:hypothetical protein
MPLAPEWTEPGSSSCLRPFARPTLRISLDAPPFVEVTIDLREVEEVTDEGCEVLLNIAEHIGERGQRMVVLYLPDRDATKSLKRTGLVNDDRIVFVPRTE